MLDVPVPPSVNQLRKLNRTALGLYADWQQAADKLVTAQWAAARLRGECSRPSLTGYPVQVTIQLRANSRLDLDNAGKSLLDYLCRIEVISDDRKKYVRRLVFEWAAPGGAPEGVRITVVPYQQ